MRRLRTGVDEEEVDAYVREVAHQHRHWLDRLLRKAREWIGPEIYDSVKPETHLAKGPPDEAISALARQLRVDLIVMGTVARTGIPGLFIGNTVETILSKINCSVLAVKPKEFNTPVTYEG